MSLAAMLARAKRAEEPAREESAEPSIPEGLQAAAEDILAALGQDYGNGPNASKGDRDAFHDKAARLAKALAAAIACCE